MLRRQDESGLSKLLVEWTLMDAIESVSDAEPEALVRAAKQHRIDTVKVRKTVEQEFATKEAKAAAKQNKAKQKPAPAAKKATASKKTAATRKVAA
jgi:hypothetical protein